MENNKGSRGLAIIHFFKRPFWIGAVLLPVVYLALIVIALPRSLPVDSPLYRVFDFLFGGWLFRFVDDSFFAMLCPRLPYDSCRGLGFDGGPFDGLEFVILLITVASWCGFQAWLAFRLYDFFKRRKGLTRKGK